MLEKIPVGIGAFLQVRFNETRHSLFDDIKGMTVTNSRKQEVFVTWKCPPVGWYALNTDGAAKGSMGLAGGGVLIRDHCGTFISALTANFGRCTAFRAEVMALVHGLKLARNLQISHLMIQLDNMACVQALQSTSSGSGECAHLINFCRSLISEANWEVKVEHVFREGNRAADLLANLGVTQLSRSELLEEPPLELSRIIDEDIRGVAM